MHLIGKQARALSPNGTVSDLKKALSSGSTLKHKNLIKVSHH